MTIEHQSENNLESSRKTDLDTDNNELVRQHFLFGHSRKMVTQFKEILFG